MGLTAVARLHIEMASACTPDGLRPLTRKPALVWQAAHADSHVRSIIAHSSLVGQGLMSNSA